MASERTRIGTLYRLGNLPPTEDGMFDALTESSRALYVFTHGTRLERTVIAGAPAVVLATQVSLAEAEWCRDMSATTGLDISYETQRPSGLILIAVDGIVYAFGYGAGHHLIPEELKDHRFGVRYAIRAINPWAIHDLDRIRPGAGGRTDTTTIPGGSPIRMIGMAEHAEIVRQIGGKIAGDGLAFTSRSGRPVMVKGGAGVHTRFPIAGDDFVAAIREVARVCVSVAPPRELEFVEYVLPVTDDETRTFLDQQLDELLGSDSAQDQISLVVPSSAIDGFGAARSFQVKIGSVLTRPVTYPSLEDILRRTRLQPAGRRTEALRSGRVMMFEDPGATQLLGKCSAANWLEVTAWRGPQRFFLMDGIWYEIDAAYAQSMRDEIADLFCDMPSIDLPPWDRSIHPVEGDYNLAVPVLRDGYVCLDRRFAANPLGGRLEIADLLGPNDTLVHVKRLSDSKPFSHVCSQVLVGTQSVLRSPHVRSDLAALVEKHGNGRTIREKFRPTKVIIAILLKDGEKLTADTLFPFSQMTLAHTARALRADLIDLEVIGISDCP